MDSLFTFESSSTSVESRNAFYNIVDRTTPKLSSPGEVKLSDQDVSEFEAFFSQYINPIFADHAFNPLLSDVVLDNTPSESGMSQSKAAIPKSQLPDPFSLMMSSQTVVYPPHLPHVAGVKRPAEVQLPFGQKIFQIGPLAKKFCTVMPSSIPARRKAKPPLPRGPK
ncbi:hypothetical protein LENED_000751 [Lentinula edodes]|uniref:Uncharacterized protein n=1 Tax=Lentinula edodes TaxID=5353 RepID=A0A1Q3DWD1_LENED|nr:hypothetical protein LENED_000751 [Lentinula edodes]